MTIQDGGQIETTTSGRRFPYTYVRKSTRKPKPEVVFNSPTAAETLMPEKTTEVSGKKTKTGKRRDGGFSAENDFFSELSSLRDLFIIIHYTTLHYTTLHYKVLKHCFRLSEGNSS